MGVDVRDPALAPATRNAGTACPPPANVRAVVRVGSEFLMRGIDSMIKSQGDDLIAALIFTAIWTTNVRHITQSPANIEFGGPNDIPPDAQRRPVSVQAVANQLGIPYETVRRYVQKMIKAGDCIRVGKHGLIVPAAVFARPQHQKALQESLPSLLRFLADLKRAEFDFAPYRQPHANTVSLPAWGVLPENARALLRAGIDLVTNGTATIASLHDGDFLMSLIHTAIWTANVRHITASGDNVKFGGLAELPPDEARRPVTINAIASGMRLPYETARRYVTRLVQSGGAQRIAGKGVIIPRESMMRPEYYAAVSRSYDDIQRTVADLYRAGFDFRGY